MPTLREILQQIRVAEEEAKRIVEEARKKYEQKIEEAEREAIRILEEAEQRAREEAERIRELYKKEGEEEASRILQEAEERVRKLKEQASPKVDEAAEIVLKELCGGVV